MLRGVCLLAGISELSTEGIPSHGNQRVLAGVSATIVIAVVMVVVLIVLIVCFWCYRSYKNKNQVCLCVCVCRKI